MGVGGGEGSGEAFCIVKFFFLLRTKIVGAMYFGQ